MSTKHQPKLRVGDVVKLDVKPVFRRKANIHISGKLKYQRLYELPGTSANMVPYANFLVKKHFVVASFVKLLGRGRPPMVQISLLENFKPESYGKGWSINIKDRTIIVKTGRRIIDTRELGGLNNNSIAQRITNKHLTPPTEAISQDANSVNFLRRNILHFKNKNSLAENYANLVFMSYHCRCCGNTLMYSPVNILSADRAGRIIDWINEKEGCAISIFPAYSICSHCAAKNLLIARRHLLQLENTLNFDAYVATGHDLPA